MNKSSNQTVKTTDSEIIFSRTFAAPRELVFETYSSCEHLMNWWGPREWPLNYCKMDFRAGGSWHYCMKGPKEGDESWGIAFYKEVTPPEKLVYTDHFSDKAGAINREMPSFDTVVLFEAAGGNTTVTVNAKVGSREEVDKLIKMGMMQGFTETWDRLEELLARLVNKSYGNQNKPH